MKHFKTLAEALKEAGNSCIGWISMETGDYIDKIKAQEIINVSGKPADDPKIFFMCSREGAVGVTRKFEYQTEWIFIPTMKTKDEYIDTMMKMAEAGRLMEEAGKTGVMPEIPEPWKSPARDAAQSEDETPAEDAAQMKEAALEQQTAPAVCVNCGEPLTPGMLFCMNCGTKIA